MASRPDDWMVEVELVEDDGDDAGAPPLGAPAELPVDPDQLVRSLAATSDAGEPSEPPSEDVAGSGRRRLTIGLLAGVGCLGVLGVLVLADLRGDAEPVVEAAEEPVFESPLRELWADGAGDVLGVVDGTLVSVVDRYSERTLVAQDLDTGEERWQVAVGPAGPVDWCSAAVTSDPDVVWCWRNRRGAVDAETGERRLQESALVGLRLEDGGILVERRTSLPSAGFLAVGRHLVMGDRDGSLLTVRRTDPTRWDDVWVTEVELEPRVAARQYDASMEVVGGHVVVHGPTVAVLDVQEGRLLQTWLPVDDPVRTEIEGADVVVTPYGFAAWPVMIDGVRQPEATWYAKDGRPLTVFSGAVAEPATSDGSVPEVLLVRRDEVLVGVDVETGGERWSLPVAGDGRVLVRQAGAVVVADDARLVSVDVETGEILWDEEVRGLRADRGHVGDGETVVVLALQGRRWILEAYAVATGERLWFADAPGVPEAAQLAADELPVLETVGDRPVLRSGRWQSWIG